MENETQTDNATVTRPVRHRKAKILPWVLLSLYAAVILFLAWLNIESSHNSADIPRLTMWVGLGILVVTQVVLFCSINTSNLCEPIKKRRLIAPVIIGGLMMAVLVLGLGLSLMELLSVQSPYIEVMWSTIAASWLLWGMLIYVYTRGRNPYSVLKRIALMVFAGSLVELLGAIPAHIIVSRRPGCLVGLLTMLGIIAGVCVAFWSLGPGIMLLFLRSKFKDQQQDQPQSPPS